VLTLDLLTVTVLTLNITLLTLTLTLTLMFGIVDLQNSEPLPFCCFGDILSVDGDADAAVETSVHKGWSKFRQILMIEKSSHGSYVHCCIDGSETWPVKKENKLTLQWAEMRMIRWTCSIKMLK